MFECRSGCGSNETEIVPQLDGPHHAKELCAECGAFVRWVSKPRGENDKAGREVSGRVAKRLSNGRCDICRRPFDAIPGPTSVEGHHIVPVNEGGEDAEANILVLCTMCHKHVHHVRTYMGHYERDIARERMEAVFGDANRAL